MAADDKTTTTTTKIQRLENEYETTIRSGLDVIQSMIDISADRLEGLRTQCATSAELTQQEIRTLEAKLVRMFSELLITKAKLLECLPKGLMPAAAGAELKQWLRVVGLSPDSLNAVLNCINTLEILLDKNDVELRGILNQNVNIREEEVRKLLRAMFNLKRCREAILGGTKEPHDLFWDSWERHSHIHHRAAGASPRAHRQAHRHRTTNVVPALHHQQADNHQQISNDGTNGPTVNTNVISNERQGYLISPEDTSVSTLTPSPSPPNSPSVNNRNKKSFPTTPPAKKKHQTLLSLNQQQQQQQLQQSQTNSSTIQQQYTPPSNASSPQATQNSYQNSNSDQDSLTKSRSQESQLTNGQESSSTSTPPSSISMMTNSNNVSSGTSQGTPNSFVSTSVTHTPTPRSRLHTEPSPEIFNDIAGDTSNTLSVPRSPCTPLLHRGMGHTIAHRFTKKFKVMSTCDLCNKPMFFGLKCKECKYRCHKDCEPNVPPSCGLPPEFIDEFKRTLPYDVFLPNSSPNMSKANNFLLSSNRRDRHRSQAFSNQYPGPDSSSAGSSCNSSSPSSPALLQLPPQTPATKHTQFHFPDLSASANYNKQHQHQHQQQQQQQQQLQQLQQQQHQYQQGLDINSTSTLESSSSKKIEKPGTHHPISPRHSNDLADTHRSNDSDKTVSLSGSTSASTDSDRTPVRLDSMEERESGHWPRQNSLSLKEWDIPYTDLNLLEIIGNGRFGTVHRALWHGAVAVKVLNEGYLDDERALEAFKQEVATFKKTRHENLVLFMGACMKPQAIVTSLCKGNTLYTHIHLRKDKFNLNRTTMVAQQISQGMGYLHAREIVHKDLKTKNIFLENGKVIITDFGLFSATKLQYSNKGLRISNNWLCYLAPELIRGLQPIQPPQDNLAFSKASDVYAFGTVWYELLCGEFPFKRQPPEAIIFQVGRGMKQTLASVQATRDVKDILMLCWAFQADDRPDFAKLLTLLERLPKKRLARSPSHPIQLSRSAESVF